MAYPRDFGFNHPLQLIELKISHFFVTIIIILYLHVRVEISVLFTSKASKCVLRLAGYSGAHGVSINNK